MFENLFESTGSFFKLVIYGALLAAATAGAVTIAYAVTMTYIRLAGSLWRHVFSSPWP